MIMLARPGYFPDIDFVAENSGCPFAPCAGGSGKKVAVTARCWTKSATASPEYLAGTGLPMEEIAHLLGYSEAGNFTHAFRRWSGDCPSAWRLGRKSLPTDPAAHS